MGGDGGHLRSRNHAVAPGGRHRGEAVVTKTERLHCHWPVPSLVHPEHTGRDTSRDLAVRLRQQHRARLAEARGVPMLLESPRGAGGACAEQDWPLRAAGPRGLWQPMTTDAPSGS